MSVVGPSASVTPITPRTTAAWPAPSGWRWVPLTQVARLETGHTPSRRRPEYWNGDVPWLSLKDIKGLEGNYVVDTADMPTMQGIDHSSARLLPKGTVALCRTASVGKAVILGRDMATSQDFVNWVCGPELLPEYLLMALRASSFAFDTEKQGSTHKTIYMPTISRFHVLLPPLVEQRRIATLLDKADAIRRKRQQAIRLAGDLLRSAFLDMFGDPVTNPRAYAICRLGESAAIVSGVAKGRRLDPARVVSVPYMRVANVQDGHLLLGDIKDIEALPEEIARYRLETGDVLLTERGDPDKLGRGAVWRGGIDPCIHQNHIFRVRPNASRLLPDFLSAQLGSARGKRYFARAAKQTTGIASINMTQLSAFPVLVPPLEEQAAYGAFVERFREFEHRLHDRHAACDRLGESLAQEAFKGDS